MGSKSIWGSGELGKGLEVEGKKRAFGGRRSLSSCSGMGLAGASSCSSPPALVASLGPRYRISSDFAKQIRLLEGVGFGSPSSTRERSLDWWGFCPPPVGPLTHLLVKSNPFPPFHLFCLQGTRGGRGGRCRAGPGSGLAPWGRGAALGQGAGFGLKELRRHTVQGGCRQVWGLTRAALQRPE